MWTDIFLAVDALILLGLFIYFKFYVLSCPKCGFPILPAHIRRVDFEAVECPECGEKFQPVTIPRPSV